MKTASRVLGIVGGCIAFIFSAFIILGGVAFSTIFPNIEFPENDTEIIVNGEKIEFDNNIDKDSYQKAGLVFVGYGSAILFAGILGILGGIFVKKKNIVAGILMLVGSAISFFTLWGIFISLLLLLGGIFALVRDSSNNKTLYGDGDIKMN